MASNPQQRQRRHGTPPAAWQRAAGAAPAVPELSAENQAIIKLTRKDFVSDQDVRWCPGCGDYSILAQTQKVMPDFGFPKENIVFISRGSAAPAACPTT